AGQFDLVRQPGGEGDGVGALLDVGGQDRGAEAAGAVVVQVPHGEGGRRDGAVLEHLQARPVRPLRPPARTRLKVTAEGRPEPGRNAGKPHDWISRYEAVCLRKLTATPPARRPSAGAVPGR